MLTVYHNTCILNYIPVNFFDLLTSDYLASFTISLGRRNDLT